jgi:hypothetical protein
MTGHLAHEYQFVRDERPGRPVLALHISKEAENPRLDSCIERRGGLVGIEQPRPIGERHVGEAVLPLSSEELVRVVAVPLADFEEEPMCSSQSIAIPALRQNHSYCVLSGLRSGSSLPVGRVDLSAVAPGHTNCGFALVAVHPVQTKSEPRGHIERHQLRAVKLAHHRDRSTAGAACRLCCSADSGS